MIWIKPTTGLWLRFADSATSIVTMLLSRSLRRLVAGTAAVLFLACQSAALAQVCFTFALQPEAAGAQMPCHSTGDGNGAGGSGQNHCDSATASASGFSIYGLAELPAITTHIDRIVVVAGSAVPTEPPLLRIESPPLSILHCCLRN